MLCPMRLPLLIPCLVAFTCLANQAECLAQKTLAWNFPQGRTFRVVMDQTTKMKMEGLPKEKQSFANSTTNQKTEMTWAVLEKGADSVSKVQQAVNRIVLEMQSQTETIKVDTNDPKPQAGAAEKWASNYHSMAGSSFVVVIKPTGEITDWIVSEETSKRWKEANLGLSEAGIKELAMTSTLKLPDNPIRVGDSWTQHYEQSMEGIGKIIVTNNYQYLGEEKVNGVLLDKIRATTTMQPADVKDVNTVKLEKQEQLGTIWFNNASGSVDHSDMQQDVVMEVTVNGSVIKQTVKQDIKLSFTARP
jgi:hypothetical protein